MVQRSNDAFLRFSYWVVVHQDQLRTWWAISIIVLDVALVATFLFTFTRYSFGTPAAVRMIGAMGQPLVGTDLRSSLQPQALEVGTAVAINRGSNRYDLVAPVTNPNVGLAAATVRFTFSWGSVTTREETTTIWPEQDSFASQLNVPIEGTAPTGKPTLNITGIDWQRPADASLFRDVSFPSSDVLLVPISGLPGGSLGTRLNATLRNNSVYSFRRVRFGVLVRAGGVIVAVGETSIDRFRSLEERTIEVTWLQGLPLNASVEIVPQVNLIDPSAYLD